MSSSITLSHGATTLDLDPDLSWDDEFDWHPVEQTHTYTTTGALIIEAATRQAGRPITLSAAADRAWSPRSLCTQLSEWAALPGATFTLVLRGAARSVVFDHSKTAFEARPVMLYSDDSIAPEDWYTPVLRFLEV